jgi:murein DD-endopeptidase MepM/ murein hydrolase activator NlpD
VFHTYIRVALSALLAIGVMKISLEYVEDEMAKKRPTLSQMTAAAHEPEEEPATPAPPVETAEATPAAASPPTPAPSTRPATTQPTPAPPPARTSQVAATPAPVKPVAAVPMTRPPSITVMKLPRGLKPSPFPMDLPINCIPGKNCWIMNYVDVDTSQGKRDYQCGWRTYDVHQGTDIVLRDEGVMRQGVPVLAASSGVVAGVRDGMRDVDYRKIGGIPALKGKDCGNGVMLKHPGGWSTQYCHMRKGSVAVKKGDRVRARQPIGLVGLSGRTTRPHIHVTVRHNKKVVDPFTGLGRKEKCGYGEAPLWKREVLEILPYRRSAIYNAGFSTTPPKAQDVRAGEVPTEPISRLSKGLVLWADVLGGDVADRLNIRIIGPADQKFFDRTIGIGRQLAGLFRLGHIKRKGAPWPQGRYRGEITLIHQGPNGPEKFTATREVMIR